MTAGRARGLAAGIVTLTLVMITAGELLGIAADAENTGDLFIWAIALVFSAVGTLIATRQPGNAIGWIFLFVGVSAGLGSLAGGYADYWTSGHGGTRGLGEAAATYGSVSWIPFIVLPTTFLLLLFPNGHLASQRWRPIAWVAAVAIAGSFVVGFLTPGPLEDYPQISNPFGVDSPVIDPLTGLMFLLLLVAVVGSATSLVVRFRRATGEERQQIKWLALAGAGAAALMPIIFASFNLVGAGVANAGFMLCILTIPIAAGVAILRYRLYDINVVINRTLVYGALTAILAAFYLGSVLLLQLALGGITSDSNLAIAASTLAVAALFRPARNRIQQMVDRRFFRRRYDAARTLESFSARLRDQVDLVALDAELRGVVAETVQPAHVSLWLRGDAGP